jgi:hypothetical protein
MGGSVATGAHAVRKPGSKPKRAAAPKPTAKPAPAPAPEPSPAPEPAPGPEADEPAIVQRLDEPSKWSGALVAGGLMLVAGVSFFAIRRLNRRK